jgi:octaprenyl-diphosphate synthase
MELREITLPIRDELETFDEYFRTAMRSKVAFVDVVARYIVRQKGKRIRPALVLLAAKACGSVNESTHRGASLVEILHTATLIHDDVVDEADTRRGFPSINAVWKNKIAVLMGDYLLAKGLLLSLDNDDFPFLKTISDAVRRMSEAEILQIAKSKSLDLDEPTYFRIISDKTASLLSTCCQIGALSTSTGSEMASGMRTYGENLGMTFQIRDDLLDYVGRKSITGKPTGLDMKEKKLTLPIIHAFTQAPRSRSKRILSIIKSGAGKKRDLQEIVEFAQEFDGIEYTLKKAEEYSRRAIDALSGLPDSAAKESLKMFVEYVMERSK